jgi:leucine-rich repeat/coiled-coil domain-containing protein 1
LLQEQIALIEKCSQEQLNEKSSQLDSIVEKLERHNERKEKLKQQLKAKELELEEIRKAYRYYTLLASEKKVYMKDFMFFT